jgi:hypothetical protein
LTRVKRAPAAGGYIKSLLARLAELPMNHPAERTPGATLPLPLPRAAASPRHAATGAPPTLSLGQISTLLWNVFGFSRHLHGRAALPRQQRPGLKVYALLPEGAYRYEAEAHRLVLVTPADLRALVGLRGAHPAALDLVYVTESTPGRDEAWEECGTLALADADHAARHVADQCAAQGLAAGITHQVAARLHAALALPPGLEVVLAQCVDLPPVQAS